MNGLQIKLQLARNQPAHWFDVEVETVNFADEVCFIDGGGEHIEIEYQGEPLRIKPPSLTDDQRTVLEWLKEKMTITDIEPIELIWRLRVNSTKEGYRDMPVYKSYRYMTKAGQFQVLAAFAEWGNKGEE